jgi:threonine aldolase
MRQAGILAAAGIVALEQMADRMVEDHARAQRLGQGLAEVPGVEVAPVMSNMVYFGLTEEAEKTPAEVLDGLASLGVRVLPRAGGRFRAVTHYWIGDGDVERTVEAFRQVVGVAG